jgi:hypothetical protein
MRQRILMRGTADLVGRLTMQQRPAPKGLQVRARHQPPAGNDLATSSWLREEIAVTSDTGGFEFRGLCAGDWTIRAEWPTTPAQGARQPATNRFRSLDLTLYDGQERHCVLEAEADHLAPANLIGNVQQNGAMLVGAVVRMRQLGGPSTGGPPDASPSEPGPRDRRARRGRRGAGSASAPVVAGEAPWQQRCDVDCHGEFCFGSLTADREYEVRVDIERAGRLQFLARRVVRAGPSGRPTRVDFMDAAGTLQLQCTGPDGPFANRMMRLRQVDSGQEGARFEVLLDGLGAAFLDAMPAGTWTLEPVHGGQCEPAQLQLGAGQAEASFIRIVESGR